VVEGTIGHAEYRARQREKERGNPERIAELESQLANMREALERMECHCIGPRPSKEDGTQCDRCKALAGPGGSDD